MAKLQKTTNNTAYMEFTYNNDGTLHAIAKRRPSKAEKKAGIVVDMDSTVIEFDLEKPDEYKCSILNITDCKSETTEFYSDAIKLLSTIVSSGHTVFIRILSECMESNAKLKEALIQNKFVQDPNNSGSYEYEKPVPTMLAFWMSLGSSLGLIFGLLVLDNIAYISIGIGLGLIMGGGMDAAARSEREKLKQKRGNCFTKTIDEE